MDKLSDVKLRNLAERGKHFDGGGLYLEVTPAGGRDSRLSCLEMTINSAHEEQRS